MLIASVLRTFEGFAALSVSGAASFFRGLYRPFGGSIVVSFGRGFGRGCGRGLGVNTTCYHIANQITNVNSRKVPKTITINMAAHKPYSNTAYSCLYNRSNHYSF